MRSLTCFGRQKQGNTIENPNLREVVLLKLLIVSIQKFRVFPHSEVVHLLLDLQPTLQTGELPQQIPKHKTRMKANIELGEPITRNGRH